MRSHCAGPTRRGAVEDRDFEALATLHNRGFPAGHMDRKSAHMEFRSENCSQLLHIAIAERVESQVAKAGIGRSANWKSFVRKGALVMNLDRREAQAWLSGQTPELCTAVGARCALRSLPMLNDELGGDESRDAEVRAHLVLPSFWAMAGAWLGGAWDDLRGEVGHANLQSQLDANPGVAATQAAARMGDTFIDIAFTRTFDEEIPSLAYAAAIDAGRALEQVGGVALEAEHRKAFAADMALAGRPAVANHDELQLLNELSLSPLWPGSTPDAVLRNWDEMKAHLLLADEDWQVWTDWYDDRLRGAPAHREVELDRISVAEDLMPDEPAVVNQAIREKIDAHTASRFPDWQLLSVNYRTGLIDLAVTKVSDEGVYERVCDQLQDTLRPLSDDRFSNLYADISGPVQLLHLTLKDRRNVPLIMHRRVVQVTGGIGAAIAKDEILASDFNVRTFLDDLNDAIRLIPEAVPAVADELAKRGGSTLVGLSQEDREVVREAANLLAANAETPVRELVGDGLEALDESEVAVPMSEAGSERVFTLGWILAKAPALKRSLAGAASTVTDLKKVFTAVAEVYHVLLKLFQ